MGRSGGLRLYGEAAGTSEQVRCERGYLFTFSYVPRRTRPVEHLEEFWGQLQQAELCEVVSHGEGDAAPGLLRSHP